MLDYALALSSYIEESVNTENPAYSDTDYARTLVNKLRGFIENYKIIDEFYKELPNNPDLTSNDLSKRLSNSYELTHGEYDKLDNVGKTLYVHMVAAYYVFKAFGDAYDANSMIVNNRSVHPGDWYLFNTAARKTNTRVKDYDNTWSVWLLNISIGGLYEGHYNLTITGANEVLRKP